jgi:hypothetical protein
MLRRAPIIFWLLLLCSPAFAGSIAPAEAKAHVG